MERYSEYKDSGVKWLGQIPSHWEISKLKWILNNNNIKVGPFGSSLTGKVEIDHPVKIYGQWNIVAGNFEAGDNFVSEETFNNLKTYEVFPGDFLVSMMGTVGKCLLAPSNIARGIMDSHILKIRLDNTKIDNRFFKYVYDKDNSSIVFQNIQVMKKGSIMDGLNSIIIKSLLIPLPSLSEQESIADFLDSATTQIDAAIAQQQKMIDLLNERKQIIINNAVTKGLDPNVKMKPSGVDWIGDIPEHWEVRRLKHIFSKIADGTHFSPDTVSDGYPYLTASDVDGVGINYQEAKKVSLKDYEALVRSGCKANKGDVLLVKDGATTGRVGLKNDNVDCVTLSSVAMLTPVRGTSELFMMYLMMSSMIQEQIKLSMAGAAMPRITLVKLNNFYSCLPPINEQDSIAESIEKQLDPIYRMLKNIDIQISLLQERKQIIINDVVTGKIKVIK